MNANIEHHFQNLSALEVSPALHRRIMTSVAANRLRRPFIAMFGLLIANLIISGVRIWGKTIELDAVAILKILFEDFELDTTYLLDLGHSFIELFPVNSIVFFLINAVGMGYLLHFYRTLKTSTLHLLPDK